MTRSRTTLAIERVTPREAAEAVSFLVAEGHDWLPGFEPLDWWNGCSEESSNGRRVLFAARAREGRDWLGVIAGQTHPGRIGFVWPPVVRESLSARDSRFCDEILICLLEVLAEWLFQAGVQVAQTILEESPIRDGDRPITDARLDQLFLRTGFTHEVRLESLELPLTGYHPESCSLTWLPYCESRRGVFEKVAARTLIDSADCRFLAGLRTGADLLAAHAGWEPVPSDLWNLALHDGHPVGLLLLRESLGKPTSNPFSVTGEISYMGIAPEFRGCGWGRGLVEQAARIGRRREWTSLRAVVDATNHYAKTSYELSGFVVQSRLRGRVRVF